MASLTFNKFNSFVGALGEEKHNFSTDTIKVMLSNTEPLATNSVKADITEIAAGNGYTAGGETIPVTWTESEATWRLEGTSKIIWSPQAGSIGPFRYIVMYNSSSTDQDLIAWFDYGSQITLSGIDTFRVNTDTTLLSGQ